MALVKVAIVNKSGQKVGLTLDEDSDTLAYLHQLAKRNDLESVDVAKPSAPRGKSASS